MPSSVLRKQQLKKKSHDGFFELSQQSKRDDHLKNWPKNYVRLKNHTFFFHLRETEPKGQSAFLQSVCFYTTSISSRLWLFVFIASPPVASWEYEIPSADRKFDLIILIRLADRLFNLEIATRSADRIFDLEIIIRSTDRIFDLEVLIRSPDRMFNLEIVIRSVDRIQIIRYFFLKMKKHLKIKFRSFATFCSVLKIKQFSHLDFRKININGIK